MKNKLISTFLERDPVTKLSNIMNKLWVILYSKSEAALFIYFHADEV